MKRYKPRKSEAVEGMYYEDIPIELTKLRIITTYERFCDGLTASRHRIIKAIKRYFASRRHRRQADALFELYIAETGIRVWMDTSIRHQHSYPVRRIAR